MDFKLQGGSSTKIQKETSNQYLIICPRILNPRLLIKEQANLPQSHSAYLHKIEYIGKVLLCQKIKPLASLIRCKDKIQPRHYYQSQIKQFFPNSNFHALILME
jgi:hypothetical protein